MSQRRDPLPPPLLVYLHANVSEDRAWCNDLIKQMSIRERKGELWQWHRDLIPAGTPIKTIFQKQLAQATAVLVLLSPNLLQDDLFGSFLTWQGSPPHAKAIPLLPILLQPTLDWQKLLGGLQVLPRNEKPLSLWENKQSACYEVAQEILSFLQQHASSLEVKEQQNTAVGPGGQKNTAQLSSEMNTYPEQMPVTPPSVDLEKLVEQLRHYTVRVHIARHGYRGTGFFVAQDRILTCAHIVQKAVEENLLINVIWERNHYEARVRGTTPTIYPNLALLELKGQPGQHPSVSLNEKVNLNEQLYTYGYPKDPPDGILSWVVYKGRIGELTPLLTFIGDEVRWGLSGAPLFNLSTGGVCGVVYKLRGENIPSGGHAIPIAYALKAFPELQEPS